MLLWYWNLQLFLFPATILSLLELLINTFFLPCLYFFISRTPRSFLSMSSINTVASAYLNIMIRLRLSPPTIKPIRAFASLRIDSFSWFKRYREKTNHCLTPISIFCGTIQFVFYPCTGGLLPLYGNFWIILISFLLRFSFSKSSNISLCRTLSNAI